MADCKISNELLVARIKWNYKMLEKIQNEIMELEKLDYQGSIKALNKFNVLAAIFKEFVQPPKGALGCILKSDQETWNESTVKSLNETLQLFKKEAKEIKQLLSGKDV